LLFLRTLKKVIQIVNQISQIFIISCIFLDNAALLYGAALYIFDSGNITMTKNIFWKNQANYGGAIYYSENGKKNENIYMN